jgi:putative transposase
VPQSLAKILVHTVFSAKDRRPFLRDKILRAELHRYLGGILTNLDCQPVIVGGVEDHVHCLCALSRTCEAAAMVKEVKRGSSLWLKTKEAELTDFAWQNGYGIFSIGFSQMPMVRDYIAGQEEHHRKFRFRMSFDNCWRVLKSNLTNDIYGIDSNHSGLMIFGTSTQGSPALAGQPWAE